MTKIFLPFFLCIIISCDSPAPTQMEKEKKVSHLASAQHDTMGINNAKEQVKELLKGEGQPFTWDTLIKNSETAKAVAEPILFDVFGRIKLVAKSHMKPTSLMDIGILQEQCREETKVVRLK